MSAAKRVLILLLSLVLILSFALLGCVIEGLTQEEIDQIIANVTSAQFDTVSFDVEMVGGSDPGTMTMAADGTGAMDRANEEMQMTVNVAGEQGMAAEVYIFGGWMYTMMDIPGIGEQWTKIEVTEEVWQQHSLIDEQLEFLETAVEIDYLGSETVNGTECYLFEVVPDMEALGELLAQGTYGMGDMDLSQFDLADLCKGLSIKAWIAKDSSLLMKSEVEMVLEMSASDVGAIAGDADKVTMDVKMVMSFYDYNEPVSIELPPEALEAEEMSY